MKSALATRAAPMEFDSWFSQFLAQEMSERREHIYRGNNSGAAVLIAYRETTSSDLDVLGMTLVASLATFSGLGRR
jgi:hypothetical protein